MVWLVTLVVAAAIILLRQPLRKPGTNKAVRCTLAALLVACELSFQSWYVLGGTWGVHALPFQLCSMMVLFSAVLLISRNAKLGDVVFFLGILGALQALLTPNLDYNFPHFRYFHFYAAHIGIIAACLFWAAVERYRPSLKSAVRAYVWLHLLAVPAAITNTATGTTNFMFLARKPDTASLLDLLGPWPWYLLQLELVVIALILILLGLMKIMEWSTNRRNEI
ncbi:TIGR02206 family membrane protein [Paenibacillus gorillae]|uniref:YwaF family protein n=1 Tax=Paenibacillus gorillae TaxID=1243662 RepID=UPI0005AA0CD6|nr:TIGR02206 family membrane protein [Paenibacillus gorillae]